MMYNKLEVYKTSLVFVARIYRLSSTFPKSEMFGLSSQIKRASTSIILNIAEVSSRKSKKEYAHFLRIALGSATEIESIFDVLITTGLSTEKQLKDLRFTIYRIRRMLLAIIKSLES